MRGLVDAHDAFGRAMLADLTAKPESEPNALPTGPAIHVHTGAGVAASGRERAAAETLEGLGFVWLDGRWRAPELDGAGAS